MNEVLWLSGADPGPMLDHLEGQASDRKLRLFACACTRRCWGQLKNYHASRAAVEVAERYANGQSTDAQLEEARQRADAWAMNAGQFEQFACMAAAATTAEVAMEAARNAGEAARQQAVREAVHEVIPGEDELTVNAQASAAELRGQAELLRGLFANPFRPVAADPEWVTPQVVGLARAADEERLAGNGTLDPVRLAILADALEDAGCPHEALVRHLRGAGPHTGGCWPVDLLLGRE
jgi:hypothetical protein